MYELKVLDHIIKFGFPPDELMQSIESIVIAGTMSGYNDYISFFSEGKTQELVNAFTIYFKPFVRFTISDVNGKHINMLIQMEDDNHIFKSFSVNADFFNDETLLEQAHTQDEVSKLLKRIMELM